MMEHHFVVTMQQAFFVNWMNAPPTNSKFVFCDSMMQFEHMLQCVKLKQNQNNQSSFKLVSCDCLSARLIGWHRCLMLNTWHCLFALNCDCANKKCTNSCSVGWVRACQKQCHFSLQVADMCHLFLNKSHRFLWHAWTCLLEWVIWQFWSTVNDCHWETSVLANYLQL